jgi:hypothetical protein
MIIMIDVKKIKKKITIIVDIKKTKKLHPGRETLNMF